MPNNIACVDGERSLIAVGTNILDKMTDRMKMKTDEMMNLLSPIVSLVKPAEIGAIATNAFQYLSPVYISINEITSKLPSLVSEEEKEILHQFHSYLHQLISINSCQEQIESLPTHIAELMQTLVDKMLPNFQQSTKAMNNVFYCTSLQNDNGLIKVIGQVNEVFDYKGIHLNGILVKPSCCSCDDPGDITEVIAATQGLGEAFVRSMARYSQLY
jgi:hypothetical protein